MQSPRPPNLLSMIIRNGISYAPADLQISPKRKDKGAEYQPLNKWRKLMDTNQGRPPESTVGPDFM
jgi:hypothetical protein